MRRYEDSTPGAMSDYNLCISYLLLAFSFLYLSTVLLVISCGWFSLLPDQILLDLNYKLAKLLGWPKYLISGVTFIWTLLGLSCMEYPLSRPGTRWKNIGYFSTLYLITVGITHLLIKLVQYQI